MTRHIENNYKFETISCWPELRISLRAYLSSMITTVMSTCTKTCMERGCTSTGKNPIDMSVYSGSTGVLFALYKYMLLVRKEVMTKNLEHAKR
jgi:hypothetical protein